MEKARESILFLEVPSGSRGLQIYCQRRIRGGSCRRSRIIKYFGSGNVLKSFSKMILRLSQDARRHGVVVNYSKTSK